MANVPCIQEKLSQEAFGGAKIRLLNSKNILIADADGTRGMFHTRYRHGSIGIASSYYGMSLTIRYPSISVYSAFAVDL